MIYCVEDDHSIRDLMLYTLRISGFEAEGFETGDAMLTHLSKAEPQLILLDIMLPGTDGLELLKIIRKTSQVPVIMATAKGTEFDKVTGLDAGADDYLVKPFSMIEMVSRVRAVLRRSSPKHDHILTYGMLIMNTAEHTVTMDQTLLVLTLKEYELLRLFLENPGQVFSREQLLEQIWGTDFFGETRTVDVHIGTLRSKLGDLSNVIRTVRGVGYRLEKSV
jgi:two-component system alkaline phosphatase synthesis response regulator PhoP